MAFTQSESEATTAATDALLGVVCLAAAGVVLTTGTPFTWARALWTWAFTLLAGASLLGAVAHGLQMSAARRAALWQPLYLSLGLAVALVAVGAVHDWRGVAAARSLLPWALGAAALFLVAASAAGGAFVIFIVYEAAALVTALVIHGLLVVRGTPPGAPALALGVAISLAAAGVQVSGARVRLVWQFDHNGLFHLAQIPGVVALALGVRANLLGT